MVEKLISKLSEDKRTAISLLVVDGMLNAQLFFRSLSFRATKVLRGRHAPTGDDAYLMRYKLKVPVSSNVRRDSFRTLPAHGGSAVEKKPKLKKSDKLLCDRRAPRYSGMRFVCGPPPRH